jgi:hypothetical protein
LLLVVEDCEGGGGHGGEEERGGDHPGFAGGHVREGAVGAALHQGTGVWFWCGDEGAAGCEGVGGIVALEEGLEGLAEW